MRISDWSSDVCSSDLQDTIHVRRRPMSISNKITPNLWFDREAEQAAAQYIDAFGGQGRIIQTVAAHRGAPSPQDVPMLVEFELFGQRFVGINGGPQFTFNEAMSLEVRVADQGARSEEHTSELQSLMRNSYADFCLKKKIKRQITRQ